MTKSVRNILNYVVFAAILAGIIGTLIFVVIILIDGFLTFLG